ncbi:MAG: ABC transporter substrate-binding protein [unclassified Hahellaceae]|nr:ABC transporter substrate-binding protein [Hahellaceae bacterium]|tara:strand:- start:20381 stop:21280 length:900 start_codon:yes stop_codon:yes gene_type:complete
MPFVLAAILLIPTGAGAAEKLRVVASFSVLGDFLEQVGGDDIELSTIVGANGDAHMFQPAPSDAKALTRASLLVVNGLGFEGWIDRLQASSGFGGTLLVATDGVTPLPADDDDHAESGAPDPHAWHSVSQARVYVQNIRDALIQADPDRREGYERRAASYLSQLETLAQDLQSRIAQVPEQQRTVVTSHDAFGYLANDLKINMLAPQGLSTESEASAADVAKIIRQIRKGDIQAVFVGNISDERLIRQIARETEARIGGTLYSDALSGPDEPAGTYLKMMTHNVSTIVDALQQQEKSSK